MSNASLLAPVLALVALTAVVWATMLIARGRRMRDRGIAPQDMPSRALADEKLGDAQTSNNALMNLFEIPVLFYVLMMLLMVPDRSDALFLAGAWIYVGLRAVQALIHLTTNNVLQRGIAYLAGTSLLFVMWLRFGWMVMLGPS